MNKYDFVYFLKESDENEELRFSLRSIEKNCGELINRVVFVGGEPKGFKDYTHIKTHQQFGTKHLNVMHGIYTTCKATQPKITDDFILMNDDFYVLKKLKEIATYYDRSMLDRYNELPDGIYKEKMWIAYAKLRTFYPNPLNFAVHIPMKVNKHEAALMLEKLGISDNFRNYYGNIFGTLNGAESIKDNKLRAKDKTWNKTAPFASSDDDTFEKMRPWLEKKFNKKSRFEI